MGILGFSQIRGEESEWLERTILKKPVACCAGASSDPRRFFFGFFSIITLIWFLFGFFFNHYFNIIKIDVMDSIVEFRDSSEFKRSLNVLFIVIIQSGREL